MVQLQARAGESPLDLNDSELATCVSCGLCLPHCPTYRVTGEEGLSPRGRIDAMRSVHWRGAAVDEPFVRFIETCVQCRGCEPACPSGVPFGRLMEATKGSLASRQVVTTRRQRLAMKLLRHHRLLLVGSTLLAAAQRLRLVPRGLGVPALPLRRGPRGGVADGHVVLFTGCVMDAWMRGTHRATDAVLTASGAAVTWSPGDAGCCGALHAHAGLLDDARTLAQTVIRALPGDEPVLVNSAGCGAAMKDYGHLLGTTEAAAFAARVRDVHEWLADRADDLPASRATRRPVIVQDPCHLRHVQRAEGSVRQVLARYVDIVELDDEGLCCGAGGAYSALQPELAGKIRERKAAAIERARQRTGATIVASANPGCSMHLRVVGVDARHPMDLVAEAIGQPD